MKETEDAVNIEPNDQKLTVKELFEKAKKEKLIQQPIPTIYPRIYWKFKYILEKYKKNDREWK